MAWTATIESKQVREGAFYVGVQYTNGSLKYAESIDMTGGTIDVLNTKIQSKLDVLNATQTLASQVTPGAFAGTAPPTTPLQVFLGKLRTLRSAQNAVDLGFIQDTDPVYTGAVADAKAAFDPSFIGNF